MEFVSTQKKLRSLQNSGVSIEAKTICRSRAKDNNQVLEKILLLWNNKGRHFIGLP